MRIIQKDWKCNISMNTTPWDNHVLWDLQNQTAPEILWLIPYRCTFLLLWLLCFLTLQSEGRTHTRCEGAAKHPPGSAHPLRDRMGCREIWLVADGRYLLTPSWKIHDHQMITKCMYIWTINYQDSALPCSQLQAWCVQRKVALHYSRSPPAPAMSGAATSSFSDFRNMTKFHK